MAEKQKRFVTVYKQTTFNTNTRVLVDKETGVNYLFFNESYGGGLTVLVDADGKPIVTPIEEEKEDNEN
jgi:hypothetical protein